MKKGSRMIYFGFTAVLMLSEMITSNLYSLLGPLEIVAKSASLSILIRRYMPREHACGLRRYMTDGPFGLGRKVSICA